MLLGGRGEMAQTNIHTIDYITGHHALNLPCELSTCGDWHTSALRWDMPFIRNTADSIFGEYGIEKNKRIPESESVYYVANHIRAILDLLEIDRLTVAQGMRDDYICNDNYNGELFNQVIKLTAVPHWNKIDDLMKKEYKSHWLDYKEEIFNGRLENTPRRSY